MMIMMMMMMIWWWRWWLIMGDSDIIWYKGCSFGDAVMEHWWNVFMQYIAILENSGQYLGNPRTKWKFQCKNHSACFGGGIFQQTMLLEAILFNCVFVVVVVVIIEMNFLDVCDFRPPTGHRLSLGVYIFLGGTRCCWFGYGSMLGNKNMNLDGSNKVSKNSGSFFLRRVMLTVLYCHIFGHPCDNKPTIYYIFWRYHHHDFPNPQRKKPPISQFSKGPY